MAEFKTDETKVVTMLAEAKDIINCLIALENINDNRSYTSLDLLEALDLTRYVILERLNDGINDWKDDDKNDPPYESLFDSIKDQVTITIQNCYSRPNQKPPRFVDTYNVLLLARIFEIFIQWGPERTKNTCQALTTILTNQVLDPSMITLEQAQEILKKYRKQNVKPKAITPEQRLEMIRNIVEKVKEQTT